MEQTYRRIYFAGFAVYAALLVLAVLFYRERSAISDSAFHTFNILKNGHFAIQNYRYGAAITQLAPLLAGKLQLSLKGVLIAYSAAFILYYAICYALCGLVFHNYRMAIVLLLSQTLFVSDTFYFMQSELPQGLAFMAVVFAYLTGNRFSTQPIALVLLALCIATMAFFHPLVVFPTAFGFLFFYPAAPAKEHKRLLNIAILLFLLAIAAKNVVFATEYDAKATRAALRSVNVLADYLVLPTTARFLKYCVDNYYWIPISAVLITGVYLWKREWWKLALFVSFIAGYISLANLTYAYSFPTDTYMENIYLPAGIMLALPLVFDVLPAMPKTALAMVLVMLVGCNGVIRMYNSHNVYTRRMQWELGYLKKNGGRKLLVSESKVPMDTLISGWATPYEFWLLSTIETGKSASIYITDSVDKYTHAATWDTKALLTPWFSVDYADLRGKYFRFTDTTSAYTIIK